ncbi:hypothetical protein D3C80_440270 [compost metagenome]
MVFYRPMIKKCPDCGFEMAFSRSITVKTPVSACGSIPFCPKCFEEFLKMHVPLMECTRKLAESY